MKDPLANVVSGHLICGRDGGDSFSFYFTVFSKFSIGMKRDFCNEKNIYVTLSLQGEIQGAGL